MVERHLGGARGAAGRRAGVVRAAAVCVRDAFVRRAACIRIVVCSFRTGVARGVGRAASRVRVPVCGRRAGERDAFCGGGAVGQVAHGVEYALLLLGRAACEQALHVHGEGVGGLLVARVAAHELRDAQRAGLLHVGEARRGRLGADHALGVLPLHDVVVGCVVGLLDGVAGALQKPVCGKRLAALQRHGEAALCVEYGLTGGGASVRVGHRVVHGAGKGRARAVLKRHGEVERLVRVGLRARHLLGEGQRAVEPARVRERERVGLLGRLDAAGAVALRGRASVRRLLDGRLVSVRVGFPHGVGGAHRQPAHGDGLAGCEEQRRAALQGEVALLVSRGGAGVVRASRAAAQRQRVGEVARKRRAVRVCQLHCEREGACGLGAVARHLLRQRERARLLRVGERRLGAHVGRDGAACRVAVRAWVAVGGRAGARVRLAACVLVCVLTLVCTRAVRALAVRIGTRVVRASVRLAVRALTICVVARAVRVANRLAARLRPHDDRRLEAARLRIQLLHGEAGVLGQVGQRQGLPVRKAHLRGPLRIQRQKPAFRTACALQSNRAGKRRARLVGQRDAEGEFPRAVGGGDRRGRAARRQRLRHGQRAGLLRGRERQHAVVAEARCEQRAVCRLVLRDGDGLHVGRGGGGVRMLRVVGQHGRHLELRRAGQHEVVPLRVGVEVACQLVAGERHLVGVERAHGLSGCARGAGQAACRVVRVGEVVGRARLRRRGQRFELAFGGMPVGGGYLAGFQLVQRRVLRERVVGVRDVHEGVHGRFGHDAARRARASAAAPAALVERAHVQHEVPGGVGGRVVAQRRAQFLGAHLLARGQSVGERGHVVARAHLVQEAQRVGVKRILVKFHLRPSVGALGHERLACGDAVGRDAEQHALAAIVKARLHHDHEVVQGHVGAGVLVFEVSDVEVGLAYGRRSGRAGGLDALPRGGVHALGRLPLPGLRSGHLCVFGEAVGSALARHQPVVGVHVVGGEVRIAALAGPRHLTLDPRVVHKVVRRPPVDAVAQLQKAQHEREPFGRLEIPRVGQRGRHRAGGLRAADQPPVEQDALHALHVHERAQVILHVEAVGGVVGRRGVLVDGGVVLDVEDGVHRAVERAGERAGVEGGKRPVHCGERVIVLNAHEAVLRIGEGDVQLAQAAQPRAVEPKGDARRALRGGFGVARAGLFDILPQVHDGAAHGVLHRHRFLHGSRL
ncbi:hypothetical protein BN3658_00598 [Coriobacteriaceae bacterium CHKCI002]|nr:hypothetical protein BN3658_00598 [Coriobacteriaceae bacterium CHKCI002]